MLGWALLLAFASNGMPDSRSSGVAVVPAVSGYVGGTFGPGWWTLDISPGGDLRVSVIGEAVIRRRLTSEERAQLTALLAGLPTQNDEYAFGEARADVDPTYVLEVKTEAKRRFYAIHSLLGKERVTMDVAAILRVWHYLRGLFRSETAIDPPPLELTRSRRQSR